MQLRDYARLKEQVGDFQAGSVGQVIGRCIDGRAYLLSLGPKKHIEVRAAQVELVAPPTSH